MFAICPTANVGRPSQPESSSAFSQRKRLVAITAGAQSSVRPRSRARSIVARASATVPASGFSEKTCFPAWSEATLTSWWKGAGVRFSTAATS